MKYYKKQYNKAGTNILKPKNIVLTQKSSPIWQHLYNKQVWENFNSRLNCSMLTLRYVRYSFLHAYFANRNYIIFRCLLETFLQMWMNLLVSSWSTFFLSIIQITILLTRLVPSIYTILLEYGVY